MNQASSPGRHCPLHYRYSPTVFRQQPPPSLTDLDVLYVVGGLYGNEPALDEVLRLFDAESGRKQLVFNGDFHWFDIDPLRFDRVQRKVLMHTALRGNVETELAEELADDEAGCGCAYPDSVDEGVVERSNRILQRLRLVCGPEHARALAALPMWQTATVGGQRIAMVHGDAESLAGWGFDRSRLQDPAHRQVVARWFEQAGVDIFASSHTCLPVYQAVSLDDGGKNGWVLNNGAAGMPNFQGDLAGMLTRISTRPFAGGQPSDRLVDATRAELPQPRLGYVYRGLHMDLVAIEADPGMVQAQFFEQWPEGSDAYVSYANRIREGVGCGAGTGKVCII